MTYRGLLVEISVPPWWWDQGDQVVIRGTMVVVRGMPVASPVVLIAGLAVGRYCRANYFCVTSWGVILVKAMVMALVGVVLPIGGD
jgi:hypothetical protein